MKFRNVLVSGGALLLLLALAAVTAPPVRAYGSTAIWQVGLSFNCNNPTLCTPFQGGFWGLVEFDSGGLGDATLVGCSHLVAAGSPGAGAQFFSVEITGWTIMDPATPPFGVVHFWITGGTMTFRGDRFDLNGLTVPITGTSDPDAPASEENPFDTGLPAVAGHYDTAALLGFAAPPGVAFVIEVVHIPNR